MRIALTDITRILLPNYGLNQNSGNSSSVPEGRDRKKKGRPVFSERLLQNLNFSSLI